MNYQSVTATVALYQPPLLVVVTVVYINDKYESLVCTISLSVYLVPRTYACLTWMKIGTFVMVIHRPRCCPALSVGEYGWASCAWGNKAQSRECQGQGRGWLYGW